jgi:hypothetical protein
MAAGEDGCGGGGWVGFAEERIRFKIRGGASNLSACLFELQLNEKQLELVGSEKQLKLDSW